MGKTVRKNFENFVAMLHLACARILLQAAGRLPRTMIMPTLDVAKPSRSTTQFATTAVACSAYFGIALLLVHVLRPDRHVATTMISGYAVGPYGWVMTTAWLAASICCLMLALGLNQIGPRSTAARLGTLVVAIFFLGILLTAIFPPAPRNSPTLSGQIHSMLFFVNISCALLGSVLLAMGFGSDPRWRPFRRTAVTLAALLWFSFALQFLTAYREVGYGYANRLLAAVLVVWLLAVSIKLRALARK